MSADFEFPKAFDEDSQPYILFSAFEWSTKGKKDITSETVKENTESIRLPLSINGIGNVISSRWNETDIGRTENLLEGAKSILAQKLKDLGGSFVSRAAFEAGVAQNDFASLVYDGVNLRQFTFTYELIPKSSEESLVLAEIVKAFKRNSLPVYSGWQVLYPNFWNIMIVFPQDKSVIKIKDCVLTNLSDNYFTDTKISFNDGAPPKIDLDLTFKELDHISKNDYL